MEIILPFAGIACIVAAIVHGWLGETRLIAPAHFASHQAKELVSLIWQYSTATWALSGVVIALSPWLFDDTSRRWAVLAACIPVFWGIIGNAWITKGRHFGWKIFAGIVAVALAGAFLVPPITPV